MPAAAPARARPPPPRSPDRRWAGSRRTRRRRSGRRGRTRGTRRRAPGRPRAGPLSPAWWPWRSLTSLKLSRSISRQESGLPVRIARPISSSRRRRIARWFMQPVTGSVPASARARTSASAVAAWSTSVARELDRALGRMPRRAGGARAPRPPRPRLATASGSSSAQLASPVAASRGSDAGQLAGVGGEEAAPGARHPADAGRSLAAGRQIAQTPLALEQVHIHELLPGREARRDDARAPPRRPASSSSSRASPLNIASQSPALSASSVRRRTPASNGSVVRTADVRYPYPYLPTPGM